jgi:alpha-glucosidase (family GH31 glycosyl hydrolase)
MKKILLFSVALLSFVRAFAAMDEKPLWGVGAMYLGAALEGTVSMERMLNDKRILTLNRFYRIGGENVPATPVECKITYTADTLYALFRCREDNMDFPAVSHGEDWFSLSGSPVEQDAAFPDKVDLFVLPDMSGASYCRFTATVDGQSYGLRFNERQKLQDADGTVPKRRSEKITDFGTEVVKRKEKSEWIVLISIPWKTMGGRPECFGLTPVRTRWRNSEVSSPVALSFHDRPAANDLFIETHFGNKPGVYVTDGALCRLPSGTLRWQRPALLRYPDGKTKKEIRKLQESPNQPTDLKNLSGRLALTQEWVDLMELEGFNFGSTRGSLPDEDMYLSHVREDINRELLRNDIDGACRLIDDYLKKLDKVTRQWFADGSPGNILLPEWTPLEEVTGITANDSVLNIQCRAGAHAVNLYLSLPGPDGIRLYSDKQGFFRSGNLRKLSAAAAGSPDEYSFSDNGRRVTVSRKPFEISLFDGSGKLRLKIDGRHIAFRFAADGGISAVDVRYPLEKDEIIFGFGERVDRFNQNGNVLTLWGMDDWLGLTTGLQNQSYKPVPVFHSSKGYMVFINSPYRLRADVGKSAPGWLRLSQYGDVLDYYIWTSDPKEALMSYTGLTGKPVLPPKWAFEPWMGRTGRGWRATTLSPVDEKKRVIRRFEDLDIPHSAIYAEGVGADMPELYAFTAPRNIRVLSWFYPAVSAKNQRELMPEKNLSELPVLHVDNPQQLASRSIDYIDFTHPNAGELSERWWKRRLDLGVAGSMVDFGDRVPEDVIFYNGKKGAEMHNFYAYDYHRIYAETFMKRRGDDFILFGRSAAPGAQQWVAQFPGDLRGNYRGLQGGLYGMLSLCAAGFSTWGSDLGGFRGWPEPEVYMRWTQFACFSPLMRTHGRVPGEPWEYGDRAVSNYKHYAWVRENLLDYIYQAAIEANTSGVPIVCSMPVAFPGNPDPARVDDQYMFGKDLMVCPVVTDGNRRSILFPPGKWTGLWDGNVVSGPARISVEVPVETIPVYLKQGAVIPVDLNGNLRFGESMTNNRIKAFILTLPDGNDTDYTHYCGARVRIARNGQNYLVALENTLDILYLIVFDMDITEVKIDGQQLPELKDKERERLSPGWFSDPEMKRTIIRLPRGRQTEVELIKSGIPQLPETAQTAENNFP